MKKIAAVALVVVIAIVWLLNTSLLAPDRKSVV